MSEKISWTTSIQVTGGPKISATDTLTVDAYDKIGVTVEEGAADKEVEIQPGAASQVQLLLISSTQYGEDLSYKVNDDTADPITLDSQQLLIGAGAIGLLGDAPTSLLFSNTLGADVTITVLVGRNAIA